MTASASEPAAPSIARTTSVCVALLLLAASGPLLAARLGYPNWVCAVISTNLAAWVGFAYDHGARRGAAGALPAPFLVLLGWAFGGLGAASGALVFKTRRRGFVLASVLIALLFQVALIAITIAKMPARD